MIGIEHYMIVAISLFSIGLAIVLTKKNAIMVLFGVELMLNGANVNFIGFSKYDPLMQGQFFTLFIIVVAAAEAALALAIVVRAYQYFNSSDLDKPSELKG